MTQENGTDYFNFKKVHVYIAVIAIAFIGYYYGSTREVSVPGAGDSAITSRIATLERDYRNIKTELDRSTEALDRSTRRVEALEARVGRIAAGVGEIQEILSRSDSLIGEAAGLVDSIEQRLRGILEDGQGKN